MSAVRLLLSVFCRKVFEPFGGLRSAINAAVNGKAPYEVLEMTRGNALMTSDPDYESPTVADVEIIYMAFDILFIDDRSVINKKLNVCTVDQSRFLWYLFLEQFSGG